VPRGKARKSLELIEASIGILEEIQPATVRAVCYRFFTMRLIDSMLKCETNKVSRQLTDARENGWLPWGWTVDETRGVEAAPTWADPAAFAEAVTRGYRRNNWAAQPVRIEVWSEKGTVRGRLAPVLNQYEVPFRVMHGFASATAVQEIVRASLVSGQPLVALYVGDHDPSGLHMSEGDLPGRLWAYRLRAQIADDASRESPVPRIVRLSLPAEDVEHPELPSFDADTKREDPRWRWYVERYGTPCWELDALSPVVVLRESAEAALAAAWISRHGPATSWLSAQSRRRSLRAPGRGKRLPLWGRDDLAVRLGAGAAVAMPPVSARGRDA
jgi:hypothetical protein